MDTEAVLRYARRPWGEAEAAKRRHWADEFAAHGVEACVRAAHALWVHVRRVRPDWPSDAARREDLEHHLKLKQQLDRAARALADR